MNARISNKFYIVLDLFRGFDRVFIDYHDKSSIFLFPTSNKSLKSHESVTNRYSYLCINRDVFSNALLSVDYKRLFFYTS